MKKIATSFGLLLIITGLVSFARISGAQRLSLKKILNNHADTSSPIDGNWELVTTIVNGKVVPFHRAPGEFKMFHDGYFSFLTYDADGKFDYAGAGSFKLDNGSYTEKFDYCSQPDHVGGWNIQAWSFSGDTLVFKGYQKMEGPTGKDMMPLMGKDTIIEKRVRAKTMQ